MPQIVLDEMLKHYKEEHNSCINDAKIRIKKINKEIQSVITAPIEIEPNYTIEEYDTYIDNSQKQYLEKNNISIAPHPQNLLPVIDRSIKGKNPFNKSGKYKDAGFKDVVIWETIVNSKYNQEDQILLFTNDNDFKEDLLNSELKNTFHVVGTIEIIKKTLLRFFQIDENIFDTQRFIKTESFFEQLKDNVENQFFSFDRYNRNDIEIDMSNIVLQRELEYDLDDNEYGKSSDEYSMLSVEVKHVKADIYYYNKAKKVNMLYTVKFSCKVCEKEVNWFLNTEPGGWDLEKGKIIE